MSDVTLLAQTTAVAPIVGASATSPKVALSRIDIARPNNTTTYAIGDVWGDATDARIHVPSVGRLNGALATLLAQLTVNSAQATKPSFDFYVFNAQPETIIGDNAALTGLSDNDMAAFLGRFSFVNTSWNAVYQSGKIWSVGYQTLLSAGLCAAGSKDFWIYVVVTNAYAPLALETLSLLPLAQYVS